MRNLQATEVIPAHASKGADHHSIREIANITRSSVRVERAQKLKQPLLGGRPLVMRNEIGKDGADLLGNRVYVLNELALIGRHRRHGFSLSKKIASLPSALKDAACIVAGCIVMMSGPILSALGLLRG